MKKKTIIILGVILTAILVSILVFCNEITKPIKISDIAYDKHKQFGYTIYIKETDGYKPYLVLTNKYNGNTLLLRKYLLSEPHIFNPLYPNGPYKNYYENSEIDTFLNIEYRETLDETIQRKIVPSEIVITAKFSGPNAHTVERTFDIFLLSMTEIGSKGGSYLTEGKPLKYFKIPENRSASFETGEREGWWFRTSSIYSSNTGLAYTHDDKFGGGAVYYANGVRPAFCVSGDEPITTRDDIIPGEVVYVFE